jgi:hypothetical protein
MILSTAEGRGIGGASPARTKRSEGRRGNRVRGRRPCPGAARWRYNDGSEAAGSDLRGILDVHRTSLLLRQEGDARPCARQSPDYGQEGSYRS